jgi:hypothetical protein
MAWRLARSLGALRSEVDAFAPKRSKASDGTLGDPAHADRDSRHNPNRYGVVTALDLTHDPAGGCDIHAIARRLVRDPHPELAYVISNGEVAKRRTGFQWEQYYGANPHDKHAHFAVGDGPDSDPLPPYDSLLSWGVSLPAPTPTPEPIAPPEDDAMFFYDYEKDGKKSLVQVANGKQVLLTGANLGSTARKHLHYLGLVDAAQRDRYVKAYGPVVR